MESETGKLRDAGQVGASSSIRSQSRTFYFIVDALRDSDLAGPSDVVLGPLSKQEYEQKAAELKLPEFTKVLPSLE